MGIDVRVSAKSDAKGTCIESSVGTAEPRFLEHGVYEMRFHGILFTSDSEVCCEVVALQLRSTES